MITTSVTTTNQLHHTYQLQSTCKADEVAKHVHIHHQTYTHLTNENELHIQPPDSATNQTFSTHRRTIDQRAPQISTANRMVQFVEHYALILTISVDGKQ